MFLKLLVVESAAESSCRRRFGESCRPKDAASYSASRWGILGLMKSAALELGSDERAYLDTGGRGPALAGRPVWLSDGSILVVEIEGGTLARVSETFTGRLWAYPLAGAGNLAEQHNPFNARRLLYGSAVSVISSTSVFEGFIRLSDPVTTNICFGGPERTTAFVTCASRGELISYSVIVPGHPLAFDHLVNVESMR